MDRLFRVFGQSLGAVRAYKLRTFFCLVSVALGIASITIIVAATEGAYKKALDIVDRFGPDSLLLLGGSQETRATGLRTKTITIQDVEAIRNNFDTAYVVVPMSSMRNVSVSYKNVKYETRVIGSTDDYSRAWTWPVIEGSDITQEDLKGMRNVALIGQHLLRELFGNEHPVGKYILVKKVPVKIVGVLSERGMSPGGSNLDDRLVIPITTLMTKFERETRFVYALRVRFLDQENLDEYIEKLRLLLRERHRIEPGEPDDFTVISPREIVAFLVALTGSLVVFLGVAGIISLVVAGFVLANLFLLSVKERTGEIGVRRAVGAKRRDILFQFLGEAVVITFLGGVAGFLAALAGSRLLTLVADFPMYFSWKAALAGLVLSFAVGIGFGLHPARRAAELSPIEAIRG